MRQQGLPLVAKRVADVAAASALLVIGAPALALAALGVRACLGSPVVFRQKRPGLNGRPFELMKLRTMTDERDQDGNLLPDSARLNPFGRLLRSTSLDELPQLLNVLRGEMSLVGPRPLLMQYLERYSPEQARRHEVLPGLTGWCQVNGRNALSWEQKLALDVWYVDHWSPWLDAKILAFTLKTVLLREGISSREEVTMPEFLGSALTESIQ